MRVQNLNPVFKFFLFILKEWREYCESFKGMVEDYNFGTLLRLDSTSDYNPENTILGKY